MKILGILLIAIGLIDLIGSYVGFDFWGGFVGIMLPDVLWKYSSFIELGVGYFIINKVAKSEVEDVNNNEVSVDK